MAATLPKLTNRDYEKISRVIQDFISSRVAGASARGVVLGISGGLDSSVVAKLCVLALGKKRVLGLVLPASATPSRDVNDAVMLAKKLRIKYETVGIQPVVDEFMQSLPADKKAQGNLAARVRMNILYHYAYVNRYLVAGTSDKSELYVGYFTKWGDGGNDLAPIADLYKTQVRALGRFLDIPQTILAKKSSPQLWKGHLAEKELGIEYETLDPILHLVVDRKMNAERAAQRLGLPLSQARQIRQMIDKSTHKRDKIPICFLKKANQ